MVIKKVNLSGHYNEGLAEEGFTFPGALQVDLADSDLEQKVCQWLEDNLDVSSSDSIEIAPPGLPRLRDIVIAWCHGKTGHFPTTVCPRKTDEGFVFDQRVDMQSIRNELARKSREGVVEL